MMEIEYQRIFEAGRSQGFSEGLKKGIELVEEKQEFDRKNSFWNWIKG